MEDKSIIDLFFARDENAIEETRLKYESFLSSLAFGILKVKEDSEECVSDTYFKAWNEIPPQRPGFLKYWLGRITRNLSLNLWNKNHASKRYSGLEVILDELSQCIPSPADTEKEADAKELTEFLERWLSSLPKEKRKLFLKRYWFGEDIRMLSIEKGTSPAHISKELFNLRKKLKEALLKEGYSI